MAAALTTPFSRLRCSLSPHLLSITSRSAALRARAIPKPSPKLSADAVFRAPLALLRPQRCIFRSAVAANEEAAAKAAAATSNSGGPTIFDKIVAKEIPASVVYEDEKVLAFRDVNPQAPVHVLVIPKLRDGLTRLSKAEPRHFEILGHLLYAAKLVADKEGLADGFRVVINDGPAGCQSVYHLHLHVLGGRQMKWPAG